MRIFGLQIGRTKAAVEAMTVANSGGAFGGGWFGVIRESFAGAFQSVVQVDGSKDILAFSAVFACVSKISRDIAKLRIKLMAEDDNGIGTEIKVGSPFLGVLRRPNRYQNRIQFIAQWIISKLLYGNTYVLKRRDARGVVIEFYILDAQRVTPLITTQGDVYYRLNADHLSGLVSSITVPASEIIHDRFNCLWHPLVGVSPLYACGLSATMGNRIQANSTKHFTNMSRPSGILTAPGNISDEDATRLKTGWETNYGGANIGRVAVLGSDLKFQAMTLTAEQSQMIDQLKWTVEDCARAFGMPLFKIGGPVPANNTVEALNQQYYDDCLQTLIEDMEACLDEGMSLPRGMYTESDLDGLLRMDTAAQIDALNKAVGGGWMAPNEARAKRNLKPVAGGESPLAQQQNFSLAALAKRDARDDPFAKEPAAPPPAPSPAPTPAPAPQDDGAAKEAAIQTAALIEALTKGLEHAD